MTQQLHAYVVSVSWSSGMMSMVPVISGGGPEQAAGRAVATAMRQEPLPEGDLSGVQVRELAIEWLRAAVRMIETGSIEAAPVVRLVEPAEPAPEPEPESA
jgi:hypothetical protein